MQLHKELFDANYWKMLQSNIKEGCSRMSIPTGARSGFASSEGMTRHQAQKGTPWRPFSHSSARWRRAACDSL